VASSRTREQLIETAASLFQRDGYDATSWRKLVDAAQTPWGSSYHHFPRGKQELAVAVVTKSGQDVADVITHFFEKHEDPGDAVEAWFAAAARGLRKSGYSQGCRVATIALETVPDSTELTAALREVFGLWRACLAERLIASGIEHERASELAMLALVNIEGAYLLCRVWGTTEPLTRAAALVAGEVRTEVSARENPLA
jgi:TetR/AcrR family transcriptional repressor of lmrAB and yxaGH operons